MRLLLFTSHSPDYLQDAIIVGFRHLFGKLAIDYPKKLWIYKGNNIEIDKLSRKPFTFFQILDDDTIHRQNIIQRIKDKEFDYILFTSVHRQIPFLKEFWPLIKKQKLIFIDGEDHPSLFGYNGFYWRNPKNWLLPKVHKKYLYFKREYTPLTVRYRFFKLLPLSISAKIRITNVYPISFAFPEEKIVNCIPEKIKDFPVHIVDPEVARKLNAKTSYAFDNEQDYFKDLQQSRFGITTKRAGWDAMRHYEIAANAAVICFKNLDQKPPLCAPNDLIPGKNCISYINYDDLMEKISGLTETDYLQLQQNGLKWIREHTTQKLAEYILSTAEKFYQGSY